MRLSSILRGFGLSMFRDPNPVYVLAIGGHVAAGKTTLSERLIERMAVEEIPIHPTINFKLRPARDTEIDGLDYTLVPTDQRWDYLKEQGEIPIEYSRGGVKYGFPKTFLAALGEEKVHQLINLHITGLVALKNHFQEFNVQNPVIPIGLYCSEEEARQRIVGRHQVTQEYVLFIAEQLNTLPAQIDMYGRNPQQFRYLFNNSSSVTTIDRLVDRAIDLFKREEKYHELRNEEDFHQQYVRDQVNDLFGMEPDELEGRSDNGEKPELIFNEMDFERYKERFGPIESDVLTNASRRSISTTQRSYGILSVLLDETDSVGLSPQEQLGNREILQRLLEIRLGVPQYVNTGSTISTENVSKVSLIYSGNSMLSFIATFSPYDLLPLVAAHGNMPNVKAPLHTLNLESVYQRGNLVVQPLERETARFM